jgi:transcriptional regulator with XRE-family HTH domain
MALNMIDRAELGMRLRMLRFRCGDPAAATVAEMTGGKVSESSILRWEQAKNGSSHEGLAILCAVYGRLLNEVFTVPLEVTVTDLLNPHYDTRVWFNALQHAAA